MQKKDNSSTSGKLIYKSKLMPDLITAESAYILYYNKAGEYRFYKTVVVKNRQLLLPVIKDINASVTSGKIQCFTEGKIHFYGKGDAVYTVYFSKIDSCKTFSFIVTGEKYFTKMSQPVKKLLDDLQLTINN
jgi:hypothetical protein